MAVFNAAIEQKGENMPSCLISATSLVVLVLRPLVREGEMGLKVFINDAYGKHFCKYLQTSLH